MKRISAALFTLILVLIVNAQSPDKFRYQAVIRNTDGSIRANQSVNIQIGIIHGSISGDSIYVETHALNTTSLGLANIVIGEGTVLKGSISNIDWSAGPYFLKIWVDNSEIGTSELISVPYAKYAEKSGNGFSGNYLDLKNTPQKIGDFQGNMNNSRITNLSEPEEDKDAVSKEYLYSILAETGLMGNHFFGIVRDNDGNPYPAVKIGSQVWLAKNLSTAHYQNGEQIQYAQNPTTWSNLAVGGYCYYNSDSLSHEIYGKLYNLYAVTDSRNICPVGWRTPNIEDWVSLRTYVGGVSIGAEKMKSPGCWQYCTLINSNSSGFSALPGGVVSNTGAPAYLGEYGLWWSSTMVDADNAYYINIGSQGSDIKTVSGDKHYGFSVRCIKN